MRAPNDARSSDTIAVRANWKVCDLMDWVQATAMASPAIGAKMADYMRWLADEVEAHSANPMAVTKAQAGVYRAVAELIESELSNAAVAD